MKAELLHPLVVHLPLGVTTVLPLLALAALWLFFKRRDDNAVFARFWFALMLCLVAASVGAIVAHETGEAGEHAIGKFLPEAALERHEQYASILSVFLYAATVVGALVFFVRRRLKGYAIALVFALSVAALVAAIFTGNAGGELVYQHKAANYLLPEKSPTPSQSNRTKK